MDKPSAGDLAISCAGAFVEELATRGVTDACLSPGSRSTALALVLARHPGIRLHVILDERSSSFFALGLAKATGRPVAVVTTSGTAVANLLPAVVEASLTRTPLILMTADRPEELRGTGANQTIDQVDIYGRYPAWSVQAPAPAAGDEGTWRSIADRAVAEALGGPGGPVHLNLPLREPLVPTGSAAPGEADGGPPRIARATFEPDAGQVGEVASLIQRHELGLILAGSLDPWLGDEELRAVEALATRAGWPLLAEPTSGLRRPPLALAAAQHLLNDAGFAESHVPDVVLQLGTAPTTRAGLALVARAGDLAVVSPLPADPSRRAKLDLRGDPCAVAAALDRAVEPRQGSQWIEAWRAADTVAAAAVATKLDSMREPFEGRIARDVAAALPDGARLFIGSSMPVRDLDTYMAPRAGLRVIGNRGASGIDGSVSTALGVAAAGDPAYALIGDLALLHDAGGLLWNASRGVDAVFVVPNNRGGGIFDHLEIASQPEHEELFVTPHDLDLGAVAAAAGARHARVDRVEDLPDALDAATRGGGVHVLEVPVDRAFGVRARADVRAAVRKALSSTG
jgi:2-succinyl-5-enolpyruvyl-6-hydroxy-3-cyclohexene-1-carboxylate synthase